MISIAPATVSQKLSELRNGKATSRAPICSGTTQFISPIMNGMAMKKIMIVPWAREHLVEVLGRQEAGVAAIRRAPAARAS